MYELQEFEKSVKGKRCGGSLRSALEDGRLRPIAMKAPKMVERHRRERCRSTTKAIIAVMLTSLVAMFCYAVWRIRDIESPSEMIEYEYRIIGTGEIVVTDREAKES
ncbi:PREDICTED: uncharacterized protein LOC105367852 [Ceratosolen solmsi marchali]|uniref:Uncharacterized protein LOC105367852 n=1 Tax=Ceratosolen solmsi marchali TaxID=326594 RepID=A0AAJ6YV81_9HYME|nr:PREDICTED: uncharacterized protein LOC105367852 [Ceratosolen solmsi marchali]